jgi:PKD repeat protein
MQKNSASESGVFNPRIFVAIALSSVALFLGFASFAATPDKGTLTETNRTLTWEGGGPYVVPSAQGDTCDAPDQCDEYTLTVDLPSDYGTKHPNDKIRIEISWDDPSGAADFDMFVHDASGKDISDSAAATSNNPEAFEFAAGSGKRTYTARVKPFAPAGMNYSGKVTLIAAAVTPTATPPPKFQGIAPRYYNYAAPEGMGETAGEPTIGFNVTSKRAMYISGLQTLRITFPQSGSCEALWEDVSAIFTSKASLDPILWTDQDTGRTFVSQLNSQVPPDPVPILIGMNSLMAFTDDDGQSWTPAQLNPPDGSYDHQNVGSGPYPPALDGINPVYPNAVYYCSQAGVTAFCSRSDDGGLNFGPSRPIYNSVTDGCGGIHGHVKVAPDGTVYVPNRGCAGVQSITVSEDAGETWTVRHVQGKGFAAKPPPGILDPSIGIGADGTLYFAYVSGETDGGHARVAVSHDKGVTWTHDYDLGYYQGLHNAVFMTAVAGDANRAAVGFLGTTEAGDHQSENFKGTWYGFVAHTYDGGKTWATVNATPGRPVQREAGIWNQGGSNPLRNLLDFTGITKDDKGNVLYAFADGCIGECEMHGPNSFSAKASIARQSGGRGLYARYDPVEPTLPDTACLSGRRDDLASYLTWRAPDNGGSPLIRYKIYRSTAPGNEVQVGEADGDKTSFTDRSTDPSVPKYFYRIVAHNGLGDGPPSNVVQLTVGPRLEPLGACALPGVQVLTDPAGDATDTVAQHDITSVSMAEPDSLPGKIVFTMKVANLSTIPPGWRWAVRFKGPKPPPPDATGGPAEDYYVAMVSSDGPEPTFSYGVTSVPNGLPGRIFTTYGPLDPASNANADGTITMVLAKSALGNPKPGEALVSLFGSVRATAPSPLPGTGGTNQTIPDSTGENSYVLRASDLCLPNLAPIARLDSNVDSGTKPLTVHFDASASSDPDNHDTIASYTFNFGEGHDDVTQSSPMIIHTFQNPGLYAVKLVVTDSRGKVSNTAQQLIEVAGPAQLLNLSTRVRVQTGDNVLIGGFIIKGSDPKSVIIRAIGPSLSVNGQPLQGRLEDPVLELHNKAGVVIATNDNWKDAPNRSQIQSSGAAPSNDRESVIMQTLPPGSYTAVLHGKDNSTGIGLVEMYDHGANANSQLANLSSRGFVESGDKVMIGGFIAGNRNGNTNVLVRAIAASIKSQVPSAMSDPTLELHDGNGQTIASNDDWQDSQKAQIEATGVPPKDRRDSAIFSSVVPGNYTAIVRGKNETGVALVEVYNIP